MKEGAAAVYLLADCNNFFVSCERVFCPALKRCGVAVLSSNDGCIVARSDEVKRLGVSMGAPYHTVRALLAAHGVAVRSSNVALYRDMSRRVMQVLREHADAVEVYSIDEAFLRFPATCAAPPRTWRTLAHTVRRQVRRATGIPLSVGVGPTKTIAKVAASLAKRGGGVCALLREEARARALARFPVQDVWQVGPRAAAALAASGVRTAAEFLALPEAWVRMRLGIAGVRAHRELAGLSCGAPGAYTPAPRKSITRSRAFARPQGCGAALLRAFSYHAEWAVRRARAQGSVAGAVALFARVALPGGVREQWEQVQKLPAPTCDTRRVLAAVTRAFAYFPPEARAYSAGVRLLALAPRPQGPLRTLWGEEVGEGERRRRLMEAMDAVGEKYGFTALCFAAALPSAAPSAPPAWLPRAAWRSHAYTTQWAALPRVHAKD